METMQAHIYIQPNVYTVKVHATCCKVGRVERRVEESVGIEAARQKGEVLQVSKLHEIVLEGAVAVVG